MAFCAWCGNQVNQVSYAPCPQCGNPSNGSQRVAGTGNNTKTAGIVIGILVGGVVIAIIGILAAIAIPNLLTALQRSRQKRTISDIRSVATALDAYVADKNAAYPEASAVADLSATLAPTYIKVLPSVDGWGTPLRYECWPVGACKNYAIGSAGADKTFEHESLQEYGPDPESSSFNEDIVISNRDFTQRGH